MPRSLDRVYRAFWAVTVRTAQSALGGLLCAFWQACAASCSGAAQRERLPERFGRVLWLPVAPVCDQQHREGSAVPLDAGALRQHFGAGLETNSLARTPRSALEPSPTLEDLPVATRRPAGG